jgi:hypothetical protein
MKDVYYSPDTTDQASLLDQVTNIKKTVHQKTFFSRSYWIGGVDLTLPISREMISGKLFSLRHSCDEG